MASSYGAFQGSPTKAMKIEASILPIELRAEKLCYQYALRMLYFSESYSLRKALQLRTTGTNKIEFSLFVVFSHA